MGKLAGNEGGAYQCRVRTIILTEYLGGTVVFAQGFVQLLGALRQVDKGHVVVFGSHLRHLVGVVHRVVVHRHALILRIRVTLEDVELLIQVMLSGGIDLGVVVVLEILTADGTYQDRLHAHGLGLVDVLAQVLLISLEGRRTTIVHGSSLGGLTLRSIVSFHLVTVRATRLLVVVGKLDDEQVACLHLVTAACDERIPIACLFVEGLAGRTRLAAVVHRQLGGVDKLWQHLCPATFVGRTVSSSLLLRRVADGVHLLSLQCNIAH